MVDGFGSLLNSTILSLLTAAMYASVLLCSKNVSTGGSQHLEQHPRDNQQRFLQGVRATTVIYIWIGFETSISNSQAKPTAMWAINREKKQLAPFFVVPSGM